METKKSIVYKLNLSAWELHLFKEALRLVLEESTEKEKELSAYTDTEVLLKQLEELK